MEIQEALTRTQAELKEAGVPESLHGSWGRAVLEHLLASGQAQAPRPAAEASATASGLGRLANRFAVPEAALADIFAVTDEDVTLHVASAKIAPAKSRATKEIALLIVAARLGAGIDDSLTDVAHVRDALAHYNRYDQSNFAKYLRLADDVFNLRGKPVQYLRLTQPGWEAASDLIKSLTGTATHH
jgi:hypothetical protein